MADKPVSKEPPFLEEFHDIDPEFAEHLSSIRTDSREDGALSAKHKTLIAMALDAAATEREGVAILADTAREQGASEEEILETVKVVAGMRGLQGLASGVHAFED